MQISASTFAVVLLLVYVDDLLLASTNATELKIIHERLNAGFELTNLGKIRREGTVFKIGLRNCIDGLLKAHGMNEVEPTKSPMDPGYLKMTDSGKSFDDPTSYCSLVGDLLYLAVGARSDIAASAAVLTRKFSAPR